MSEDGIFKGVSVGMDLGDSPVPANLPSLRTVRPKFARNTIEIRRDAKREWHEVASYLVEIGDTVAEVGMVAAVTRDLVVKREIVLENVLGNSFTIKMDQKVLAFIRV